MAEMSFAERLKAAQDAHAEDLARQREREARRADPAERERLLNRAHELVNEGRASHNRLPIGHEYVIAAARFLAGE